MVQQRQLQAGLKEHAAHAGIALGKEFEVRDIDIGQPAPPHRTAEADATGVHPAMAIAPVAVLQDREGVAGVAEDAFEGGFTDLGPIAGRDGEVDRLQAGEFALEVIDHGGGQPRHRTGAADHQHFACPGLGIQATDIADITAAIGQVDAVGPRLDACTGDAVVLALEWAAGMNDDGRRQGSQLARKAGRVDIQLRRLEAGTGGSTGRQLGAEPGRPFQAASGDHQLQPRMGFAQVLGNPLTEVAVPAQNQHPRHTPDLLVWWHMVIQMNASRRVDHPSPIHPRRPARPRWWIGKALSTLQKAGLCVGWKSARRISTAVRIERSDTHQPGFANEFAHTFPAL
ncbi:hypothetical protein D9M71_355720 [compost metagenome]